VRSLRRCSLATSRCSCLALADIALDGHEARNAACFIAQRLDFDFNPVRFAGFAIVDNLNFEAGTAAKSVPHFGDLGLIRQRPLEKRARERPLTSANA